MDDVDFTECRFIRDELRFLFFKDFCHDCYIIKRLYKNLSDNGKIFYKYYVYSNINISIGQKNAIWEFLNGDGDDSYLYLMSKK